MTKEIILNDAEEIFTGFAKSCGAFNETAFFERPEDKWSVAENMQHLILSINTTRLAYSLPRFLVRWVGGTPKRNSSSYDELLARYNKKISEGAKASSRYVPKPIEVKYGKEKLLQRWNNTTSKFTNALRDKRTEADLDRYQAKHPLLGSITLRELAYFTIFHTKHHLETINKRWNTSHDPIF